MSERPRARSGFSFWSLFWKLSLVGLVLMLALVIWCDMRVRAVFDGDRWEQPAKVYSRPLILASGVAISQAEFLNELSLLGYRRDRSLEHPGSYYRSGDRFHLYLRDFHFADGHRPARKLSFSIQNRMVRELRDVQGRALVEAVMEPAVIGGVYPGMNEDRMLIALNETPRMLVETLLLVEDRDFYRHAGISPKGIARAAVANIKAGRTVQGGSTLTQQLVKNLLLTRERSFVRKFLEVIMALLVELHYDKDTILQAYINEVYLGQEGSRAIHGFALAARHYFNRPVQELNIRQIAMLVGLVKGPSYYDPWRFPERSLNRRNVILAMLADAGFLEEEQRAQLAAAPLGLAKSSAMEGVFPAYIDLVRRQLRRDYRNEDLQKKGLRIFTPFDPLLQRRAEQSMKQALEPLDEKHPELQSAMVVTSVKNGDVVAVVGGRRPRFAGFNRALDALRPVGSLMKPAVYLAALERPRRYTLASRLLDEPVEVENIDGTMWRPKNFDKESHGEVLLHRALALSYNQAAVRLGLDLGVDTVIDMVRRLGVERPLPEVPAIFLGAASLSPIEVAAMYQTLADDGRRSALRSIVAVTDANGELLAHYPQKPHQAVSAASVHLLQYAMQEVVQEGTGRGVYGPGGLSPQFRVAGKTGSTNDLRDSWFAGFAGDYLGVVWVGRDDNAAMGLTGSRGALPVWRAFMKRASREPMPFVAQRDIEYHWIDAETGFLSASHCDGARNLPFIAGSEPRRSSGCRASPESIFRWFRNVLD